MTPYNMDMSEEKAPKIKQLLPEGNRPSKIVSCKESKSKAGNQMFIIGFRDKETGYVTDVYAVAEKGKRWFLKMVLEACTADFSKWEITDILEKDVMCKVVHEDNEWTNREGDTIITKQHKIIGVENISWDE